MILEIAIYLLIFIVLLTLSAFFSGSETAYFSLTPAQLETFKNSTRTSDQRITKLMSWPRQLLITIVLGNTMVNITIASIAALLTSRLTNFVGVNQNVIILIDVFVVTFVILVLSEILPKVIAVRNSENFSIRASLPLTFIFFLLYPISYSIASFTRFLQSRSGFRDEKTMLTEEELKTLAEVGEEQGSLLKDEREMIHSIFEFGDTTVREIMVPRTDMIIVDTTTTLAQLMRLVKTKLHSRIPVFKDKIDNIIGILYVKDLLPYLYKKRNERIELEKLARPAYFVPEQKKIDELLREFQAEHIHMALVVDEYGGISGIVTLEDIIEEIVGEIQDEYDKESPLFKKLEGGAFQIDGRMSLEEVNDELDLDLPSEEGVETISGFILSILGSLPKEKEEIKYNNYRFVVEKINRNRILKVRVEKLQTTENESPENQPNV